MPRRLEILPAYKFFYQIRAHVQTLSSSGSKKLVLGMTEGLKGCGLTAVG